MQVSRSEVSAVSRGNEPSIHPSAVVHRFSNVVGPVTVGKHTVLGPGTSLRAEPDTPFHLGQQARINDGAVIHGHGHGRVLGDDDRDYAVWVGDRSVISHLALVHGPAYIGAECFIGFRSTIFNARLGNGCIVMMHALVQDVEVPPGRFVPSGSVVLTQEAADALPAVRPRDREFVVQLIGDSHEVGAALGANGANGATVNASTARSSIQGGAGATVGRARVSNSYSSSNPTSQHQVSKSRGSVVSTSLCPELVQQVRQLLAQGYKVSAESADKRRFQTASWNSCGLPKSSYEAEVLSALEGCLSANGGNYVRLIGVDSTNKRRVFEDIIQRPGDHPGVGSTGSTFSGASNGASSYRNGSSVAPTASVGNVAGDIAQQIQQLVSQGYGISLEFTSRRRFQVSAWTCCGSFSKTSANEVLGALESCMANNQGNYVRVLGVDTVNKRRVFEAIVQRPSGPVASSNGSGGRSGFSSVGGGPPATAAGGLDADVVGQIRNALASGCKISAEFTDPRRFRVSAWTSCGGVSATSESQAIAQVQACMADHPGDYVRVLGVDTKAKRRVFEAIVQRPGSKKAPARAAAPETSYGAPTSNGNGYSSSYSSNGAASYGGGTLPSDVVTQVQQLLAQGYKIGTEHVDRRRFQANSWYSCKPIDAGSNSQVIAALESCLTDHSGEYVRVIGIDPQAKRRVYEEIIQRP
ncbi:MAG: ribulose bisphosphate carboxylase small subunit [Cyanobacteria bacterium P01_D01_bin.73]